MSNSRLGYLAGCMNQTQFLLLCNACVWVLRAQHRPVPQLWPALGGWWLPAQAQRGKERLRPFEDRAVTEIGKAERCFCKGSLAPKLCSCSTQALRLYKESQQDTKKRNRLFLAPSKNYFSHLGINFPRNISLMQIQTILLGPAGFICQIY